MTFVRAILVLCGGFAGAEELTVTENSRLTITQHDSWGYLSLPSTSHPVLVSVFTSSKLALAARCDSQPQRVQSKFETDGIDSMGWLEGLSNLTIEVHPEKCADRAVVGVYAPNGFAEYEISVYKLETNPTPCSTHGSSISGHCICDPTYISSTCHQSVPLITPSSPLTLAVPPQQWTFSAITITDSWQQAKVHINPQSDTMKACVSVSQTGDLSIDGLQSCESSKIMLQNEAPSWAFRDLDTNYRILIAVFNTETTPQAAIVSFTADTSEQSSSDRYFLIAIIIVSGLLFSLILICSIALLIRLYQQRKSIPVLPIVTVQPLSNRRDMLHSRNTPQEVTFCSHCLDLLTSGVDMRTLDCGHSCHTVCMRKSKDIDLECAICYWEKIVEENCIDIGDEPTQENSPNDISKDIRN